MAGGLTENLQISAGYTFNKSKYKNADEVNAERLQKNSGADPYNFSNFTPAHMFCLGASYRVPRTKLTLGAGVSAQSKTAASTASPKAATPSSTATSATPSTSTPTSASSAPTSPTGTTLKTTTTARAAKTTSTANPAPSA